ncbi:flagellar hook-basal body complex protein FliE [soil metagenome]
MNPLAAMKAYSAVQGGGMPSGGAAPTGAPGFGEMLQNVMGDMQKSTKAAETQMSGAISGQSNMIDVVTSVSSAEASLETVIAVRDQVIQAYQEIMRMPI